MKRIALLGASLFAMVALAAAPASAAPVDHPGDGDCWTQHHHYQCDDDWWDWNDGIGGLGIGIGIGIGL